MIELIMSLVSIIFLLYIIPYNKWRNLQEQYPSVWLGLALQWFGSIGLEIYLLRETYDHHFYGKMRIAMLIVEPALDVLCMIFVFAYVYKNSKPSQAVFCAMIVTFSWSMLRQLISLFFFTPVYPIEIVSTVGIVAFGITIAFMWAHFSKTHCETGQSDNDHDVSDTNNANTVCCIQVCMSILIYALNTFAYFSIIIVTYFLIILYITFLNSFQTSPDNISLVFMIIFSFLPPILAAAFEHTLEKWTKKDDMQDNKIPRSGYERMEDGRSNPI